MSFRERTEADVVLSTQFGHEGGHVRRQVVPYENRDVLRGQARHVNKEHTCFKLVSCLVEKIPNSTIVLFLFLQDII